MSNVQACKQDATAEGRQVVLVGAANALDETVDAEAFE